MRRICWNGTCLEVPADWDPLALGLAEMRLGPPGASVLSVKWTPIRGGFSTEKHFRKIARAFAGDGEAAREDWRADAAGQAETSGREVLPYVWRTGGESGLGAVVHDTAAGMGALLQARTDDRAAARAWLDSLQLARPGFPREFEVFDIRAEVPAGFDLESFFFKPGHFGLTFARGREQLVLERLGPADVLLQFSTLALLAGARWPDLTLSVASEPCSLPSGHGLEWSATPGPAARLAAALLRRRPYSRLRVWHEAEANRILVAAARAPSPLDAARFDAVCRSYVTLRTRETHG